MTHEQLVVICFQWHWNTFIDERRLFFGVNNNSANKIEGNKNKAKGVVAGVFDFIYILPNHIAVLDAKVGNDVLSDEQLDFAAKVQACGGTAWTFSSLREFQDLISKLQTAYYV